MKKTILLASLVAVASMAAGTEGTVKGFYEGEHTIVNKDIHNFAVKKVGVETEVKVKDTGLSFGGTFQGKDIKVPLEKHAGDTFFNNSNLFIKYELPKMKGINSSVKATLNPKVEREEKDEKLSFKAGNVQLEGDINYDINKDVKVGLNSKTTFPFKKTVKGLVKEENGKYTEDLLNYGANVESTHKVYVEAFKTTNENKREESLFKDIKAHIAVTHAYAQSEKVSKEVKSNAAVGNDAIETNASKDNGVAINEGYEASESTNPLFTDHEYKGESESEQPGKVEKPEAPSKSETKKDAKDVNKSFKSVELHAEGVIKPMKDLEIKPEANFKYQHNGDLEIKDYVIGDADSISGSFGLLTKMATLESYNGADYVGKLTAFEKAKAEYEKAGENDKPIKKTAMETTKKQLDASEEAIQKGIKAMEDSVNPMKKGKYFTALGANFKYTGLKDTEINVKPFINHLHFDLGKDTSLNYLYYGVKGDVKYTGVKNLTLTGKATLSGVSMLASHKENNETKTDNHHIGVFNFGVGAKYDYKVTDKFTVSLEANISANIYTTSFETKPATDTTKAEYTRITSADLTLAPKVSAEYKPIEDLTIKGAVEVPINFGPKLVTVKGTDDKYTKEYKFGFNNASVKTSLNVEYKWK